MKRRKSSAKDLFTKILLKINSSIIFYSRLRNYIYKKSGINFPHGSGGVYIAREVLLDDNFPELITIEFTCYLKYVRRKD